MSYDSEIKDRILRCYAEGVIEVIDSDADKYFGLIESNFPIGLNRINWEKVRGHFVRKIDMSNESNAKVDLLIFIQKLKSQNLICGEESVYVFGDDSIRSIYKLPFYAFEENIMEFVTLPQHTYVISENASWCLNYTFEDELFFGRSLISS